MLTAPSTAPKTSSRPMSSAPSRLLEAVQAQYWQAACQGYRKKKRFRLPARLYRRGLRHPLGQRRPGLHRRQHRYEPNSPYSASKAASDHLVRAWHHTYGLPVLTTNCSNNYGPLHFPEKLIPLMIVNALAGKNLARVRRRHAGPRLAVREVTTAAPSAACSKPAAWARPTTWAAGTKSPTSRSSTRCAPCSTNCDPRADGQQLQDSQITYVTDRPGPRPPLRHRCPQDRSASWAGSPPKPLTPASARPWQWYLDNPEWVAQVQIGRLPGVGGQKQYQADPAAKALA